MTTVPKDRFSPEWWLFLTMALVGGAIIGGVIVGHYLQKRSQVATPQAVFSIGSPAPIMTNKEEITWTDRKGRKRTITIHREVH